MHQRIETSWDAEEPGLMVNRATARLIEQARSMQLDLVDGVRLPDLALLAHLQHHGAATPLLDVTVDWLVALWMVVNAAGDDPAADDDEGGRLFAIAKPSKRFDSFDGRSFYSSTSADTSLAADLADGIHWYGAPDVSERLRIQRGSFILSNWTYSPLTTLDLAVNDPEGNWFRERVARWDERGRPVSKRTEVVVFNISAGMKGHLRSVLAERAGFSRDVIYPTPWNRPHLEAFCRDHRRTVGLRSIPAEVPSDEQRASARVVVALLGEIADWVRQQSTRGTRRLPVGIRTDLRINSRIAGEQVERTFEELVEKIRSRAVEFDENGYSLASAPRVWVRRHERSIFAVLTKLERRASRLLAERY